MSNKGKITKPESGKPSAERRRRALTIVGALIVFATFIVKEQIRDYLKDLRDSIAGADSLYTLERDIGTVEIRMVQIDEEIAAVSARQKIAAAGSPTVLQYPREIKTATAMIRERDAALQADFDRLSGLAEKLVFGRDALRDPLARMSDAVSKCHEATERKLRELESQDPKDAATLGFLQLDVGYLLIAEAPVLAAGGAVLEQAKKEEEWLEAAYSWCNLISFLLYLLGWGLGLYGALSGMSAPGSEG